MGTGEIHETEKRKSPSVCFDEGLGKASYHPGIKLMKCYMILQGPEFISCIVFTLLSLNLSDFSSSTHFLQFMNHTIHEFLILFTSMVQNCLLAW